MKHEIVKHSYICFYFHRHHTIDFQDNYFLIFFEKTNHLKFDRKLMKTKDMARHTTMGFRSSTCGLTGFFWLLSHVIYLKLTKVLLECLLSQTEYWVVEFFFLSLTNWGLNFLQNKSSQTSHINFSPEKLRKLQLQACKFFEW